MPDANRSKESIWMEPGIAEVDVKLLSAPLPASQTYNTTIEAIAMNALWFRQFCECELAKLSEKKIEIKCAENDLTPAARVYGAEESEQKKKTIEGLTERRPCRGGCFHFVIDCTLASQIRNDDVHEPHSSSQPSCSLSLLYFIRLNFLHIWVILTFHSAHSSHFFFVHTIYADGLASNHSLILCVSS